MNILSRIARTLRHWHKLHTMPLRLEFVVTDTCNLNCKGCTHYSPLAPKEFADLQLMEHNMDRLAAICGNKVKSLYLIGGETLLYPHLIEAVRALRHHFPTQRLYIFTNAIALPRMSPDFWTTAASLHIVMAITRYPIKFDYDAAISLCHRHGVETEVFGDRALRDSFFKFALDPQKRQNPKIAHFKCYNRGCMSIIGTRLYPCSISGCVSHLNQAAGTQFTHQPGDYLEIDNIHSLRQIQRLRNRPVPFCGYCILPPQEVTYGPSRRDPNEWL